MGYQHGRRLAAPLPTRHYPGRTRLRKGVDVLGRIKLCLAHQLGKGLRQKFVAGS